MLKKNISYVIYASIILVYLLLRKTLIFTNKISYELLHKIPVQQEYVFGINIIVAITTIFVVNKTLDTIKINKQQSLITSILFTITPAFIFTSIVLTKYNITLLLLVIAIYFISKKEDMKSTIALSLFGLFGIDEAIIALIISIMYFTYIRKQSYLPLLIAIPIITNIPIKITNTPVILELLSDIGMIHGFSFITIIFSLIGFGLIKKKYSIMFFIYSSVVLVIANYLSKYSIIYLILPICYLSGKSIYLFIKNKESLVQIKKLTKIVIICGLLFTTLAHINLLSTSTPTIQILEISQKLENATKIYSDDVTIINYYTKKPIELIKIDSLKEFNNNFNNYSHIYISENTLENSIKIRLNDAKTFKKTYNKNNHIIYEVGVN